jgi:hypothetical protein
MDSIQFLNLRKQLKPGQELVLDFDGNVKIVDRDINSNKTSKKFMGILEDFPDSEYPNLGELFQTKSFLQINSPKLKSFRKFGEPLPKRDNNTMEVKILIGIVLTFKNTAKRGKYTDSIMKFDYDTIEVQGIIVYFSSGIPRFLDYNGKRIFIAEKFPEMKLEKFPNLESVK